MHETEVQEGRGRQVDASPISIMFNVCKRGKLVEGIIKI